jgi:hypothetical protein
MLLFLKKSYPEIYREYALRYRLIYGDIPPIDDALPI